MTKVPEAARAVLRMDKITAYLLSETHTKGRHKCNLFKRFGFSPSAPDDLAGALKAHPLNNEVVDMIPTPYGTRYVVECSLRSPDGRDPCFVSIWQMKTEGVPDFITAYPK